MKAFILGIITFIAGLFGQSTHIVPKPIQTPVSTPSNVSIVIPETPQPVISQVIPKIVYRKLVSGPSMSPSVSYSATPTPIAPTTTTNYYTASSTGVPEIFTNNGDISGYQASQISTFNTAMITILQTRPLQMSVQEYLAMNNLIRYNCPNGFHINNVNGSITSQNLINILNGQCNQ